MVLWALPLQAGSRSSQRLLFATTGGDVVTWRKPSSLLLALLLALSVGVKLGLDASEYGNDSEQSAAKRVVTAFLAHHGFQIGAYEDNTQLPEDNTQLPEDNTQLPEDNTQLSLVAAVRGVCRLRIAIVSPRGWHRDIVRRLAEPDSRVFFVADGAVYQDQPIWRTRAYFYWRQLNGLSGRRLPAELTLGVIQSAECDWLDASWSELAKLP
jgi:hypothetical protein